MQPSGAKSWAVRYRANGIPKKLTLGSYPALSLRAARERAQAATGEVAGGKDPAAEKKAARQAAKAARGAQSDRVERVVERFIELHAKPNTRDWRQTERLLAKYVVGRWSGRRLSEVTRADVNELLDEIAKRAPIGANRVFAQLRKMCNWSIGKGIIEHSPCAGVETPSRETTRDRVLNYDEIRLVWQASDTVGWPFGSICKLLLLTGARREEIAGLRRSEIDLSPLVANAVEVEGLGRRVNEVSGLRLLLPKERTKNKRDHVIPLSDEAVEIIRGLPRVEGDQGFVFTTTGKSSVSGFSRAKEAIDAAILEALKEEAERRGEDPAKVKPLSHWTLHDLRRTVATNLQALGVRLEVTEAVLNHVSGSKGGIVGIYQRHEYASEKRQALEFWARRLDVIVRGGAPAKVLEFIAKARAS